jgi:hypothetical protein
VESEVIRTFRDRVRQGNLAGVTVKYRVSGGMPGEDRINEELTLSGSNKAVELRVMAADRESRAASAATPEELRHVMQQLESGLDTLVTRSEARFLPDSVVGSFTIEIGGQLETLFFLVDEEEQEAQQKRVSPGIREAVRGVSRISERLRRQVR